MSTDTPQHDNPLPARSQAAPADAAPRPSAARTGRRRPALSIPSVDELLRQVIGLNQLTLLQQISVPQASLIQRGLKTVIDTQLKRASGSNAGPGTEPLVELVRRDPSALNAVAEFLSPEQVEQLLREAGVEDDDAA